jgi:hypothetical protein
MSGKRRRDPPWTGLCLPQTTLATVGIFIMLAVHVFSFFVVVDWIDGRQDWVAIVFDVVSLVLLAVFLLILISRIRELRANGYMSLFVEDLEFTQGVYGFLAFLVIGFVHFFFTISRTQNDYLVDIVAASKLYMIHLAFVILTWYILVTVIGDFAANGIEQRRALSRDAQGGNTLSGNDTELYGIFPPLTAVLVFSLIFLLVLHIVTICVILNAIDGTTDTMRLFYLAFSVGLGVFYLIFFLLQYTARRQNVMRLGRDLEFSHLFYGLLLFLSMGSLYGIFTSAHVPADYSDPALAAQLNAIYFYYLLGTLVLIVSQAFDFAAKGNEERRVASLGATLTT